MKSSKIIFFLGGIIVIGLALWGLMLKITWNVASPNPLLIDMGRTGATLSLITVIGALVQWILKDRDAERQKEKETLVFYRNVLSDLKSVYDKVEKARLLIQAHRTAKTYGEQIRELIEGVVILHNIQRALNPQFPKLQKELEPHLKGIKAFIKGLLNEYRDNYKRISFLQEIDQKQKAILVEERAKSLHSNIEDKDIPSKAWQQIMNLNGLGILKDEKNFEKYKSLFLEHLDAASAILRKRIPVEKEN